MVDALLRSEAPTVTETFSLSSCYRPKEDVFTIELSKATLTFKALKSYADIKQLARDASDYVDAAKPYSTYGADDETKLAVFSMAQTSLEPKLGEADLFRFMAEQGFEFNSLKAQWEQKQTRPLVEAELAEVEAQKKPEGESP